MCLCGDQAVANDAYEQNIAELQPKPVSVAGAWLGLAVGVGGAFVFGAALQADLAAFIRSSISGAVCCFWSNL